jgi:hypothetical protein
MSKHKFAMMFLTAINIMNLTAGVITQVKLLTGSDIVSIIPISVNMSVVQILMLNFMAVSIIMTLISIITTYLVTDVPYSPKEIFSNCAGIFLVIPVLILFVAVFNAINTPVMIDKISIIVSAVIYLLFNAINIGCLLTIKEDED